MSLTSRENVSKLRVVVNSMKVCSIITAWLAASSMTRVSSVTRVSSPSGEPPVTRVSALTRFVPGICIKGGGLGAELRRINGQGQRSHQGSRETRCIDRRFGPINKSRVRRSYRLRAVHRAPRCRHWSRGVSQHVE